MNAEENPYLSPQTEPSLPPEVSPVEDPAARRRNAIGSWVSIGLGVMFSAMLLLVVVSPPTDPRNAWHQDWSGSIAFFAILLAILTAPHLVRTYRLNRRAMFYACAVMGCFLPALLGGVVWLGFNLR